MCFGCSKEQFIETVLLSTHNICFGGEIRKIIFKYAFLSGGLDKDEFESTSLLQKSLNLYKPSILFCVCVGGGGAHTTNSAHPDQILQNKASDPGLYYFLAEYALEIENY